MFRLEKISNTLYEIYHEFSIKNLGHVVMLEDGYFHIQLFSGTGYWTDDSLIQIGNLVKKLNAKHDKQVKKDLEKDTKEQDLDDLENEINKLTKDLKDEF